MPISFQWFHKTFNISTNDRMVGFHGEKKEDKIWIIFYIYIYIYIYNVFEKDTSKRQIKVV